MIDRVRDGGILIILKNRGGRISKAQAGIDKRLHCSPVLERKAVSGKTIRAAYWRGSSKARGAGNDRCPRQKILIHRPRQVSGMNVNVAGGDRQAISDLPFDAK